MGVIESIERHYKYGITHAGIFHADDVFAGATLKILFGDEFAIQRVVKVTDDMYCDTNAIIFDIGGERAEFDHHYIGSRRRTDGRHYSSFGLIWDKFASKAFGDKVAKSIDNKLVRGIDALDTGELWESGSKCKCDGDENNDDTIRIYSITDIISSMNPTWRDSTSSEDMDKAYNKAVEVAKIVLENLIHSESDRITSYDIVEKEFRRTIKEASQVLVFETFVPWENHFFYLEKLYPEQANKIKYVVHPSLRGGYLVTSIPITPGSFDNRSPFPSSWNEDISLAGDDVTFIHPNGFCGATRSLAGALELCKLGLGYNHVV